MWLTSRMSEKAALHAASSCRSTGRCWKDRSLKTSGLRRETATTSQPSSRKASTAAAPTSPLAPATSTFPAIAPPAQVDVRYPPPTLAEGSSTGQDGPAQVRCAHSGQCGVLDDPTSTRHLAQFPAAL